MRSTKVTTRKEHKCCMCRRKFPKGTEMVNFAHIGEDGFVWGYTCMTCDQIISFDIHDPWYFGDVSDNLEEGQTPEGLLSKLKQEQCERILAQTGTLVIQTSLNMMEGHLGA